MGRIKRQHQAHTPGKITVVPATSSTTTGYREPGVVLTERVVVDDDDDDVSVMSVSESGTPRAAVPIATTPARVVRRRRKKSKAGQLGGLGQGVLWYSVDVLTKILSLLKWPLALFLTLTLARFLLVRSVGRITGAIQSQVRAGVCAIPFAAPIVDNALPGFCELSKTRLDFNDLIKLQKETVQAAAVPVYSGSLPLKLKKAELATSDLRAVLQVSDLSCKGSLDEALNSFSTHARDSSRAIQKTVVRVGGMLDASLAMNEWAIGALNRIEQKASGIGGLIPFIGKYDTRTSVTATYVDAMDEVSEYLQRLIESNQEAYESLDALEEDLHLIHEIVGLEKQFQQTEQGEVLSSLWSLLGGNQKLKKLFRVNLSTLDDFERSRLANKEVVAQTSVAFNKMMLQIEHLRERVQRPGLSGDTIPIEMHIRNIELGIEELRLTRQQNRVGSADQDEKLAID